MLDAVEHSIVWRIRGAASYLGSIIPNVMSAPVARDKEVRHRQWREAITPQRMNRLSNAHSVIEEGLKYLIRSNVGSYTPTHELGVLLGELRACNSGVAASLDNAFDAATEFYGTDTQHPDHRHLASLSDYVGKSGTKELFKCMRYVELESSIDDPALEDVHIEFHYEILCVLDEVIQPIYGTTADRVEYFARRAFLDSRLLDSLASHGQASKEAYVGWLEDQDSFVHAIRQLTASRTAIKDEHANRAAIGVCYDLTGSEDLALRTIAFALVQSGAVDLPAQHREIETRVWRPEGAKNDIVTTPAGDLLGHMRNLPTGFWLATNDLHDTSPEWFRTESDARSYLARLSLIEVAIVTARGSSSYCLVNPRPVLSSVGRGRLLSVHWINWAGIGNTDRIWLKLWDSQHDLRVGERIEIREDPDSAQYWRARVTHVAGQNVYLGETELQSSHSSGASLEGN